MLFRTLPPSPLPQEQVPLRLSKLRQWLPRLRQTLSHTQVYRIVAYWLVTCLYSIFFAKMRKQSVGEAGTSREPAIDPVQELSCLALPWASRKGFLSL